MTPRNTYFLRSVAGIALCTSVQWSCPEYADMRSIDWVQMVLVLSYVASYFFGARIEPSDDVHATCRAGG